MPRSTLVRQLMTTDVLTFSPHEAVSDATRRLLERGVGGGPVVDEDGRVVGMLTSDDLLVKEIRLHYPTVISLFGAYLELPSSHRHFEDDLRRAVAAEVGDVMHGDPVTCAEDDTLERVATLMHERQLSRLPVTAADKLVGIIARGDVLRAMMTAGPSNPPGG